MVDTEPHGDDRRPYRIGSASEARVRLLPVGDGLADLAEPPQRVTQASQGLGRFLLGQRLAEAVAGPRPVCCPKGLVSLRQLCITPPRHGWILRAGLDREAGGMDHRSSPRAGASADTIPAMSLEIDRVTKRYGTTLALDRLEFAVPKGEIFGFLGANGAGKTTTMRICLGIINADAGEIRWEGTPAGDLPRRTWGYLPEERGLYPRLTVLDQLVYFASLYGERPEDARREARHWLARFRISDLADRRAEELSKGNQQKVQFVAAILHDPEVLLMDEPFTGLDPVNVGLLREAFVELRDTGRTIVFSTHQMELAESLCESVAIIDRGRLVAGGSVRSLKRAAGRRMVRLTLDDDAGASWLGSLAGVTVIRSDARHMELELTEGLDPGALLAQVVARGIQVTHFELADPTLEAIFIDRVGRAPDDAQATLAP